MFCSQCGIRTNDNANFCPQCGTPVNLAEAQVESQSIKHVEDKVANNTPIPAENAPKGSQFCTNCGTLSTKKVCDKCGVKNRKARNFCYWCGTELNPNASICVCCGEKVRPYTALRVISIIYTAIMSLWAFFCVCGVLAGIVEGENDMALGFAMMAIGAIIHPIIILLLPAMHMAIKKKIYNKNNKPLKKVQRIATWLTVLVVVASLVVTSLGVGLAVTSVAEKSNHETQPTQTVDEMSLGDEAVEAAKVVLQNRLKNPLSLQVHDASVKLTGFDDDHNPKYFVELDYSAQNGFGGMDRDTYKISLVYRIEEGAFYSFNTRIIID